ncbi:hypothetical protein HDU98_001582 [Podochytrium sp. JEL0797]|nr:hypothetical protein HDU98_001582 [Podochytrium sp. JEL0797]
MLTANPPPPDASDTHLQYLHCNRCGYAPLVEQPARALFVAQCSHVLCLDCLQSPKPGDFDGVKSLAHKCVLCGAVSAVVRVGEGMPEDVAKIISPFIETLETALEVAKVSVRLGS